MDHKSLFERMERKIDLQREIKKFDNVICVEKVGYYSIGNVFEKFFREWKHRYNYMSMQELRSELRFDFQKQLVIKKVIRSINTSDFFQYCELIANLSLALAGHISEYHLAEKLTALLTTMQLDLAELNHRFETQSDERTIVIEINPAATAVSETLEPEVADKVIEYNHYLLRGDLVKKREILRTLAHKYDAKKPVFKEINKALADKISFLLNNMNIRHNNQDPTSPDFIKYVAELTETSLEHWYDETYQTLLFALLAVDQVARNQTIDELKAQISETK